MRIYHRRSVRLLIIALSCLLPTLLQAKASPLKNDVAVTAHEAATQAALNSYEQGGNAIDAAVAAALALGVVEPQNSGLGGGGFMLIYLADKRKVVAIDYREMAPKLADENTYSTHSSTDGYAAIGVPGQLKGLELAQKRYGKLSLATNLQAAISLAENGFDVSPLLASRLQARADCLKQFPSSRKIFFAGRRPLKTGDRLVQKDLAQAMKIIAQHGVDAFYKGSLATQIVDAMSENDGLIRKKDLSGYKVKVKKPVVIPYHGYTIYSMPLPSSGGILLKQMFQVLRDDPLLLWGWDDPRSAHLIIEVMKLAFADRAQYLGDDDFVTIPPKLTDPRYAAQQRNRISPHTPIQAKGSASPANKTSQTTHASFADRFGNAVAMINSLNLSFGSCVVIPGTGIVMNDEMDDFSTHPGKPNAFGLMQSHANRVQPGKQPLSSMTPTIVTQLGQARYVIGTPGGPTIITNVFQVLLNLLAFHMPLKAAVNTPKLHEQYLPDVVQYQPGYPAATLQALQKKGHKLKLGRNWGNVEAIAIDWKDGVIQGVADPRGEGTVGSVSLTSDQPHLSP